MKRVAKAMARWYRGEYVSPENDPRSQFVLMQGHQRIHWSARAMRRVVQFYLEHWKWIWTPLIAGAIALALRK